MTESPFDPEPREGPTEDEAQLLVESEAETLTDANLIQGEAS